MGQYGKNSLVCRYVPDRQGSRIVLREDSTIRFVSAEVPEGHSL